MASTLEAVRVGKIRVVAPEGPFRNEPFVDFTKAENARAMRDALRKVKDELGRDKGRDRIAQSFRDLITLILPEWVFISERLRSTGSCEHAARPCAPRSTA